MGILGIIIIAIAISFKYKKDIGETVPVAILGSSIFMYLLGRYTNLNVAFVAMLLLIAISLAYCLYKLFRRDAELSYITSWGGRALLFYILFFGLYSISRDFSQLITRHSFRSGITFLPRHGFAFRIVCAILLQIL